MIANFDDYRILVTAEFLPDACTACPFWCDNLDDMSSGTCLLTGTEMEMDGLQDEERMDDCIMTERKNDRMKKMLMEIGEVVLLVSFILMMVAFMCLCALGLAAVAGYVDGGHTARAAETTEAREVVVRHVDSFDASAYLTDTYLSEACQTACRKAADRYGLDPYLLMAMVEKESSGDPEAESSGGDIGLLQVNPRWHLDRMERMGVTDLTDPDGNIMVAADYLNELLDGNRQNTALALMKFNMNHARAEELISEGIISDYAQGVMERAYELRFLHERSGSDE